MYETYALRPLDCIQSPRACMRVVSHPSQRPLSSLFSTSQATSPSTISLVSPTWFDLPLQAVAVEHVTNNTIQRISYGMGFYSVGMHFDVQKPDIGGEGVRPVITTATTTHSTPQIFFCQLARMRACPTPVACPTVRVAACVHVVPLGAIDEFCGDLVERVPG